MNNKIYLFLNLIIIISIKSIDTNNEKSNKNEHPRFDYSKAIEPKPFLMQFRAMLVGASPEASELEIERKMILLVCEVYAIMGLLIVLNRP